MEDARDVRMKGVNRSIGRRREDLREGMPKGFRNQPLNTRSPINDRYVPVFVMRRWQGMPQHFSHDRTVIIPGGSDIQIPRHPSIQRGPK